MGIAVFWKMALAGGCIGQITVSCGCTTASTDAACYRPGDKGLRRMVLRGDSWSRRRW